MNIRIVTGKTKGLFHDALVIQETAASVFKKQSIIKTFPYLASNFEKVVAKVNKYLSSKNLLEQNITFFIEFTAQRWIFKNNINVFVPNQEWYYECYDESLKQCDYVLCKTKVAEVKFKKIHPSVRYVGFTSKDKLDSTILKDYRKFLHVRGQSAYKGTQELLNLWRDHPEWPELLVISRNSPNIKRFHCHNIRVRDEFISDEELKTIQNNYGVHLCPSSVEGFGHYISEALSCKSIIVTTNASPMNELVDTDSGFLADYDHEEELNFGTAYRVSRQSLENQIINVLSLPVEDLQKIGGRARKRYERQKQSFENNMQLFFKDVTDR